MTHSDVTLALARLLPMYRVDVVDAGPNYMRLRPTLPALKVVGKVDGVEITRMDNFDTVFLRDEVGDDVLSWRMSRLLQIPLGAMEQPVIMTQHEGNGFDDIDVSGVE